MTYDREITCPVPVVETNRDYPSDEESVVVYNGTHRCDHEIYLTWQFSIPIDGGPDSGIVREQDVPSFAAQTSWRLECTAGHVLALSQLSGIDGDDPTEDFDSSKYAAVFGLLDGEAGNAAA